MSLKTHDLVPILDKTILFDIISIYLRILERKIYSVFLYIQTSRDGSESSKNTRPIFDPVLRKTKRLTVWPWERHLVIVQNLWPFVLIFSTSLLRLDRCDHVLIIYKPIIIQNNEFRSNFFLFLWLFCYYGNVENNFSLDSENELTVSFKMNETREWDRSKGSASCIFSSTQMHVCFLVFFAPPVHDLKLRPQWSVVSLTVKMIEGFSPMNVCTIRSQTFSNAEAIYTLMRLFICDDRTVPSQRKGGPTF